MFQSLISYPLGLLHPMTIFFILGRWLVPHYLLSLSSYFCYRALLFCFESPTSAWIGEVCLIDLIG